MAFLAVPSLTVAALCGWFALSGHRSDSRAHIRAGWLWGFVLGGFGLTVGFYAPLLLAPQANQGPLLGILVTGPAGFVIGAIGGVAFAKFRARRSAV